MPNQIAETAEFNADELEAPEWLNAEYFTEILQNSQKSDKIKVLDFVISPASARGDHYASIMFRAKVNYEKDGQAKQMFMIIKTMPIAEGTKKEHLKDSYLFETEIGMYTEVLPRFQQILRKMGDDTILAPQCLHYTKSPQEVIVFEDLCPDGFIVVRNKSLSMQHVKAALLRLAKYHAMGYKLNLEEPGKFDKYRHGLFSLKHMSESDLITGGLSKFLDMLDQTPTLRSYKPYLEQYEGKLINLVKAKCNEYYENRQGSASYVLTHGDFHRKNMMFKHHPETGHVEDMRLLDFQICSIALQPMDVIYALFMIMDAEMRMNHRDELLYYYFSNFVDTLKKMHHPGPMPKYQDFRRQLFNCKHFEIFLLVTFLPIIYDLWDDNGDMEAAVSDGDYRAQTYFHKEFQKELHSLLPKYLHEGYFED